MHSDHPVAPTYSSQALQQLYSFVHAITGRKGVQNFTGVVDARCLEESEKSTSCDAQQARFLPYAYDTSYGYVVLAMYRQKLWCGTSLRAHTKS